jgi:hypothetical protein
MKATEGAVSQALEFERFQATATHLKVGGDVIRCLNKNYYAIPGVSGFFRRVSRSGSGLAIKREGARLATFNGSIIELIRDQTAETEIREAGFTHLGTGPQVRAPTLTREQPGLYPGDTPPVTVNEQQGKELREAGLRTAQALSTPQEAQARRIATPASGVDNHGFDSPPPPEADGDGLTAAEILEEQRRQATHE